MNTEEKGPAEVEPTPQATDSAPPKVKTFTVSLSEMIRIRLFVLLDQPDFKGTPKGEEVKNVIRVLQGVTRLEVIPKEPGVVTYN